MGDQNTQGWANPTHHPKSQPKDLCDLLDLWDLVYCRVKHVMTMNNKGGDPLVGLSLIKGAILRSYVNVNVPDFFKDQGGYTHLLHAFATREFRKDLTISERSSS